MEYVSYSKSRTSLVKDDIYIYSMWSGRLVVYNAALFCRKDSYNTSYFAQLKNQKKGLNCSGEPGEIYGAMVWFPERNDDMAATVLEIHFQKEIKKLEEKRTNYLRKISLLGKVSLEGE